MIALFFDTETDGFGSKEKPASIVQIAAILQDTADRRVLGELSVIVHTGGDVIPEEAIKVHGIDNALNERFGVPGNVAESLFYELAKRADVIVAYNLSFDMRVVKAAWPLAHSAMEGKQYYCAMINSAPFDRIPKRHAGGNKYPKLSDAYLYFTGTELDGAHDAMIDTRACRDVYFGIQDSLPRCTTCDGELDPIQISHLNFPVDRHSPVPNETAKARYKSHGPH